MKRQNANFFFLFVLVAVIQLLSLNVHAQWKITSLIIPSLCDERGSRGGEVSIVVSGVPGTYTYSWSSGGNTNAEKNLPSGSVSVQIQNGSGKDTSATYFVPQGACDPSPSQVFTPNGDGIHDVWIIGNYQFYPNMLVLVYNRWGQLVYEKKGNYEPWDGKSMIGTPLDEATYYYIIYEDAGDRGQGVVQGSVTIMR